MRRLNPLTLVATCGAFLLAGCAGDPFGRQPRVSSTAIGSVLGSPTTYAPSDVIGGRRVRAKRVVGSGIRAVPDANVGTYIFRLESELRRETAGTGLDVYRLGNELLLRVPSSITFDVGSATVKAQSRATLTEVARTLNQYPATIIDVLGHTDASGSPQPNQRLSERRAQAIADYLVSRKVRKARIATRGYGETNPISDNFSEAGKAANRRVEIRVVPARQSDVS